MGRDDSAELVTKAVQDASVAWKNDMKRARSYQSRSTLWGREPHRSITCYARLDERAPNSGKTRANQATYGNNKVGYEGLCDRGSNRTFGGEALNPTVGTYDDSSWITPRTGMGDREAPRHEHSFHPMNSIQPESVWWYGQGACTLDGSTKLGAITDNTCHHLLIFRDV